MAFATTKLGYQCENNPKINDIKLPSQNGIELEARLNQYVDDTQFSCEDETSVIEVFHVLSIYEKASGAKINGNHVEVTNCCAHRTGQTRTSQQLLRIMLNNDLIKVRGDHASIKMLGYYGSITNAAL